MSFYNTAFNSLTILGSVFCLLKAYQCKANYLNKIKELEFEHQLKIKQIEKEFEIKSKELEIKYKISQENREGYVN